MLQSKTMTCPLSLITPDGDITVNAVYTIAYDPAHTKKVANVYGDDYCLYDVYDASVQIELNGEVFSGQCSEKDCPTEMAFCDLACKLPQGVKIKSCLTCRHGNFFTLGANDNEIFCVTDFEPKKKTDLDFIFLTENNVEWLKRRRSLFHVCPDYKPDAPGYWSYK